MKPDAPWHFRLRCWLRILVVASPGLQPVWLLCYRLAERVTVFWISRFCEVRALYLRRGASKGELLPGVSDLDWTVVLGPISSTRRQWLHSGYSSISRVFPFLESELATLDEVDLLENWSHPETWYRWREARQTWQLKLGRDVLVDMPALPAQVWAGWHREVKTWINVWVRNLINHPWRLSDRVYRNATSFKLLSEFVKIEFACFHGRETFQRSQALAWLPAQHPWRERLIAAQNARFLQPGHEFAQWCFIQMLLWLEHFRSRLSESEYGRRGSAFLSRRLGQPEFDQGQKAEAAEVANWARELWGQKLLDWRVSTCLCFSPLELVLLLKVDPGDPPRIEDVRAFSSRLQNTGLKPYLWFASSALSLRPDWNVSDNSLLSVDENPDLFLSLQTQEEAGYSRMMLQFFSTRWGREPAQGHFESEFWWSAQMAVYFAYACENALVVPRSRQDIGRELELLGYPIDFDLHNRNRASAYLRNLWAKVKERPMHNFG